MSDNFFPSHARVLPWCACRRAGLLKVLKVLDPTRRLYGTWIFLQIFKKTSIQNVPCLSSPHHLHRNHQNNNNKQQS